MSFRFNEDEEVISCDTLESFRESLVAWNRLETNTYERVFTVFKPFSRFNWDIDTKNSGLHAVSTLFSVYMVLILCVVALVLH